MRSVDIPLHDIGPILEIREYSLYWFILLAVIVLGAIFFFKKKLNAKKTPTVRNRRRMKYESLMRIDTNDTKSAAYAISEQGLFFAQESEEMLTVYRSLLERLEKYKYAPVVEAMDEETLALYRLFLQKITL